MQRFGHFSMKWDKYDEYLLALDNQESNRDADVYWDMYGVDSLPSGIQPKKDEYCWHDWKEYVGFREQYKFCTKCGIKENLDGTKY